MDQGIWGGGWRLELKPDDDDGDDGDHRCYSHGCHQRHGLS